MKQAVLHDEYFYRFILLLTLLYFYFSKVVNAGLLLVKVFPRCGTTTVRDLCAALKLSNVTSAAEERR